MDDVSSLDLKSMEILFTNGLKFTHNSLSTKKLLSLVFVLIRFSGVKKKKNNNHILASDSEDQMCCCCPGYSFCQ